MTRPATQHCSPALEAMPYIAPVTSSDAPERSSNLLHAVHRKLGHVPNMIGALAHSPASLRFYLGQVEALSGGRLPAPLREQIALVVAGINRCDYCADIHTLAGQGQGLGADELSENRQGRSLDARTQAVLDLASAIVRDRGHPGDAVLDSVRTAGFGQEEVIEIVAHVAMNLFTNYFNHIAGTAIDSVVGGPGE